MPVIEYEEHYSFSHGPTRVYRLSTITEHCNNVPFPAVVITRKNAKSIDKALTVTLGELTRNLLSIAEAIQVAFIPGYICITLRKGVRFGDGQQCIHSQINLFLSFTLFNMQPVRADKIEPEL